MTLRTYRLECADFWVDVRLANFHGRWMASADTPDGPSLGLGRQPLEAGEDLAVVSRALGHTSVATTADVYGHWTPAMADRLAARMEAVLGG